MWLIEKVIVNVRYLDEQAGNVISQTISGSSQTLKVRTYWTWDWYIVVRTDGQVTVTSNMGLAILAATYVIDTRKNLTLFGVPSLTATPFVMEPYTIPRSGPGYSTGWLVQNSLSIYDIKRDKTTTQATIVGQWDAWAAYGRATIVRAAS